MIGGDFNVIRFAYAKNTPSRITRSIEGFQGLHQQLIPTGFSSY